jgi:hypothetical protein
MKRLWQGEPNYSEKEKDLSRCHFFHNKSHLESPGIEFESQRREADSWPHWPVYVASASSMIDLMLYNCLILTLGMQSVVRIITSGFQTLVNHSTNLDPGSKSPQVQFHISDNTPFFLHQYASYSRSIPVTATLRQYLYILTTESW